MSIENPKVSVIMPVYNTKEEYLREAIESILNQTFSDFEFIIANDGSANINVEKVILSYEDRRIKYFKLEKNEGLAKIRNRCVKMAKGSYIAMMDSDDVSMPKRLEKQVNYLDNNKDVGVVSGFLLNFEKDKDISINKGSNDYEFNKIITLIGCPVSQGVSMIRKNLMLEYKEEYSTIEDYDLWSRLNLVTNFANIQEVLLKYRRHKNNTSSIKDDGCELKKIEIKFNLLKSWFPKADTTELYLIAKSTIKSIKYRDYKKIKIACANILKLNEETKCLNNELLKDILNNYILNKLKIRTQIYRFLINFVPNKNLQKELRSKLKKGEL